MKSNKNIATSQNVKRKRFAETGAERMRVCMCVCQ